MNSISKYNKLNKIRNFNEVISILKRELLIGWYSIEPKPYISSLTIFKNYEVEISIEPTQEKNEIKISVHDLISDEYEIHDLKLPDKEISSIIHSAVRKAYNNLVNYLSKADSVI